MAGGGEYARARRDPMSQGEYHSLEQPINPDAVKTAPGIGARLGNIRVLVFVFGVVVLGMRVLSLGDGLTHAVTNPALLKEAMRTAAGAPASTVTAADLLPAGVPVSGFQSRAMSEIAQRAGQSATAEAWLIQGLSDPSAGYLSQFEMCLLYWNAEQRARAREACRGTQASAIYWLNRGYVADQAGDRAEALAAFQMASSIDPELTAAWQQAGHALFALGRYDEAILAYEQVMALEQSPPADVVHSLGRSYLQLDDPLAAREVLVRGLELYPNQRLLYLAMAQTYRDEGDLEKADNWYGQMVQRWPFDDQGWAARGEMAMAAGRVRDAMDYYREAVKIQPDDVGYWLNLAMAAASSDNMSLAASSYRKAMELRPDDATLWLQAGRHLVRANQSEEAKTVFEHVLELEPGNSEAAFELARLDGSAP